MKNHEQHGPTQEYDPALGKGNFLDVLSATQEIRPIPNELVPQPDDTFDAYVNRATSAPLEPGIYLADPSFGEVTIPDMSMNPATFSVMSLKQEIDTRGTTSGNGFFALEVLSGSGDNADLAFRPFHYNINDSPEQDFAKNAIVRRLGLENTQTIGMYTDGQGVGGTISLLDRSIRSADTLAPGELDENDPFCQLLTGCAQEIAYAHSKGIVHGDLAMRNIVQHEEGSVFLIDWGLARIAEADGNAMQGEEGTLGYDIAKLETDFVYMRPTADGRSSDRTLYRDAFKTFFGAPYLAWRSEFNEALTKSEGRLPDHALAAELAELEERFLS